MKADDVPPDVPPAALNPEKDPDAWVTKDEPMTGPQRSYLQTLCREAKEEFDQNWTKAEASKKIEQLRCGSRVHVRLAEFNAARCALFAIGN